MASISFARHQYPPAVIRHAVWLYLRFTLSYRDVEDLLAERGLDVSYETVRRWVCTFGPLFARELRSRRPRPSARWHLASLAVPFPAIGRSTRCPGYACWTSWLSLRPVDGWSRRLASHVR